MNTTFHRRNILAKHIWLLLAGALLLTCWQTAAANGDTIIYGVNQFGVIAEVNLTTENVFPIGTLAFGTQAADQDPLTGYVYYFDRPETAHRFYYWDPVTQTNTNVATYSPPLGLYPKRLAFAPDGQLYMMDDADILYTVSTTTGAVTLVDQVTGLVTGSRQGTGDMAFTPDGTLYLNTYGNLYTVDLSTREATPVFTDMLNAIDTNSVWTGLAYCHGLLYGSAIFFNLQTAGVYSIHPATGELTEIFYSAALPFNDLTSCPTLPTAVRLTSARVADAGSAPEFWSLLFAVWGGISLLYLFSRKRRLHS